MAFLEVVLGFLPGFAWLVFYLSEDPHPEPKRMIVLTFFAGIAFGFFTIIVEQMWNGTASSFGIDEFSILSLLVLGFIEEFMKFGAAYFAVGKSPELDEPVDRMIYMVVAALGFATLENIGAVTNAVMQDGGLFAPALQAGSLRFVGATLLHSLTSGIIGYHWALGAKRKSMARNVLQGFAIAAFLHAFFNYLILNDGDLAYSVVFLVVIGFFVLNDFEKLKVQPAQT